MHRRRLLLGAGTALAGLAGCSGSDSERPEGQLPDAGTPEPTSTPTPTATPISLRFPSYEFAAADDGSTVVVLTVSNPAAEPRQTTMTVVVQGPDGESVTGSTGIDVGADEEATYRVPVPVDWSWFDEHRNLQGVRFGDEQ